MELVALKKEQEQYRQHLMRLQNVRPLIDTSAPGTLGLAHLKAIHKFHSIFVSEVILHRHVRRRRKCKKTASS